jgi:ankyrin repeat protein
MHMNSDNNDDDGGEGEDGSDNGECVDGGTGSGIPGDTFLHKAMRERDAAELQRLLAAGADPNSADCSCITPLYMAAERGLAAGVKALLLVRLAVWSKACASGPPPMHASVSACIGSA